MHSTLRNRGLFRRRGVIDPVTALALISMVLTAGGTARQLHRGAESGRTADELTYGTRQIAGDLKNILDSKYQRMLQGGQLTRAEYETLQHRLHSDATDQALQAAVAELADKQRQLADDAFWDLEKDTAISLVFSAISEGAGAVAGQIKAEVQAAQTLGQSSAGTGANILRNLRNYAGNREAIQVANQLADQVGAGADTVSSLVSVNGLVKNASDNPYIVTKDDFLAAVNRVQQGIQSGGPPGGRRGAQPSGDAALLVRTRIRAFFDKWCVDKQVDRYRDPPNHENWVHQHRSRFQQRCHADFAEFIRSLEQDGWSVPGKSLANFAWQTLTASRAYLDTFGRDYSGVYRFTAAQPDGRGKRQYEFRFDDRRDGTATVTLVLPPNINIQDLPRIGLPAKRELVFPLQAKIDRDRSAESSFSTDGREIHALTTGVARIGVGIGLALSSMFGGDRQQADSLIQQTRGENCLLELQPVSADSNNLDIKFSADLIVPDTKTGQMKRQKAGFTNRATRIR